MSVSFSGKPPLLLTNYPGGGIGDFGVTLERHLKAKLGALAVEVTSSSGEGSVRQSARIATHRGQLISNLGLTAWGKSPLRNFAGFASVGAHYSLGYPTTAIVHHAIEVFDIAETGFHVTPLVQRGAHAALKAVSDCDLVVFSPRIQALLETSYGARKVWLTPLPGERARQLPLRPRGDRLRVISAGYWAPYKGIDTFLDIADQLRGTADFILAGRPHPLLSSDPAFKGIIAAWTLRARSLGVKLPGFLTNDQLDSECSDWTIALLPYTSVSGASASFQLFAERAVPVIAPDLPEFRYLERCGAGILLSPRSRSGLADTLIRLSRDSDLWFTLANKQEQFSQQYCWEVFVNELVKGIPFPKMH